MLKIFRQMALSVLLLVVALFAFSMASAQTEQAFDTQAQEESQSESNSFDDKASLVDSQSEVSANYSGNFVLKEGDKIPRSKTSELYHDDITEVLADDDFGRYETVELWRIKDRDNADDEDGFWDWDLFPDWFTDAFKLGSGSSVGFAFVLELLLWLALGAGIVWLVLTYREQIKGLISGVGASATPDLPVSLFGIELEQSQLPENIVSTAIDLWNKDKRREATALLLRASLIKVLNQYPCHLFDSDTENECVAKIQQSSPPNISAYMRKLVDLWLALAYAHIFPSEAQFKDVCASYQEVF